ncbi:MAG: leucine--tRNA ligase [Thermodesulfobacteriota bacterium]|nr:MAG: leucine--tRNA ligase [Thermodesulfobacteriota bacterium]
MSVKYDHKEIELRWQAEWEEKSAFAARPGQGEKYYCLEMFPYPSGKIHMGHVRNYSIGDVLARFLRMRGMNVLHPMGWDSFGLPAENAAIEHSIHPAKWTHENIAFMRRQLKRMGLGFDWTREISTCSPEYYKWNQWIFLKFYEKGLAYKRRSTVNWCPGCSTVLANEQVEEGLCWRCASAVEAKDLEQWFFRITDYAEELLDFTHKLPGWPERVLVMQRNWIGKSMGAEVSFPVDGSDEVIRIFTTRPDTLYGVTFMTLAPEHPLVERITAKDTLEEVRSFVKEVVREKKGAGAAALEKLDKKGVFTGAFCVNPLTGAKVPVYVANFVLMEYGTGAVMAVPAHDQRDFEFARAYGLPVKVVINPRGKTLEAESMEEAYVGEGILVNSGPFDGMLNTDAVDAIIDHLEEEGVGRRSINYKLRDWGISRQRYWGCPIPVIYCKACGTVGVDLEDLPVVLPEEVRLTGTGRSPLESAGEFVNTVCPRCKGEARRETDTMDTFVDSSWYFLRYLSPGDDKKPFEKEDARYWMPVDQYIGGIEHAVMHLLYARFFTKALRDLGLHTLDEPFKNLLTQGMVCKETARCGDHGFLSPGEVTGDGKCGVCGAAVEFGAVEKMSKSKKNTIDPDGIIERYGADTTRLFSLFAAPPEKDMEWSAEGVEGSYRFLGRVWRLVTENALLLEDTTTYDEGKDPSLDDSPPLKDLHRITHGTIKKVTGDIEKRFHFNTAISSIMELVNAVYALVRGDSFNNPVGAKVFRESVETVVLLLAPFAPHITEELWQRLGNETPLYKSKWPVLSEDALVKDEVTLVVQVNGRVRAKVVVPVDSTDDDVKEAVMKDARVAEWAGGKELKKFIHVPGRLVNLVVR